MKKMNQKNEKRHSLKLQFTLFFVFFVVVLYGVVIIITLHQINGITEVISAQLGLPIVEETAALIDGDAFERLSRTLDPLDPYYEQTRLRMAAIKEKSQCVYLYAMAPLTRAGAVYRYIIDGSAPPDDKDNFSPLGTTEDISAYLKYVTKTMKTRTSQTSGIDYTTPWGWVVSAYAPIVNSSGVPVGIVRCDFRVESVYEQLWLRIILQMAIYTIFVFLASIAYLYLVHGINRQNKHLLALKEDAEKISLGLKDEWDTITAMKDAPKVGVFFMDKNFIIQDHYSRYLETVLGRTNLAGEKFTDLLSASISPKNLNGLVEYFVLLFNRSLINNRDLNVQLAENINPVQELTYIVPDTGEEKELQWTFVPVDWGSGRLFILGNIQDITLEKALQQKLAEEEQKRREETNSLFELLRSDQNIIQGLERIRQEKAASAGMIDKILSFNAYT
jgi:methyl-accepting chemotaxis protein